MIPGMNPRQMEAAMKKMGIKQVQVPASEVIIKSEGADIIITNPQVVRVNMMGQDSFQISGVINERSAQIDISTEDVSTVASQAGVSEDDARQAIINSSGDLAQAILELKK